MNIGHDPTSRCPWSRINFDRWIFNRTITMPPPSLHSASKLRWITSVRWSHVLQDESSIASLKALLRHVSWSMIALTRVHTINAPLSHPTLAMPPRRVQKKNSWGLSPTWRKRKSLARIKGRGAVRICVTDPIISPGPTNPWALQIPASLLTTWRPLRHSCGLAWPLPCVRVSSGNLGSPRGPRAALPRSLACRVASAQVSRATSALLATSAPRSCRIKPPFCDF